MLTIKVFQNNEHLKNIKAQAEIRAALAVTKALFGCHDMTITGNEIQKEKAKETDFFADLEKFKAGIDSIDSETDLALMIEIINARLQSKAKSNKVKKVA